MKTELHLYDILMLTYNCIYTFQSYMHVSKISNFITWCDVVPMWWRLCDKLFIVSIFIKFQSPPNIYKRSVSNIDTNIGLGLTDHTTTTIYYARYCLLDNYSGWAYCNFLLCHFYVWLYLVPVKNVMVWMLLTTVKMKTIIIICLFTTNRLSKT